MTACPEAIKSSSDDDDVPVVVGLLLLLLLLLPPPAVAGLLALRVSAGALRSDDVGLERDKDIVVIFVLVACTCF